jgi:hypothetical protein
MVNTSSISQNLTYKLGLGLKNDMALNEKIKAATKNQFLTKVKLLLNSLFGVYKYFAIATKKEKMEIEQAIIYLNNIIDNINIESEKQLDLIEGNILKFNYLEICKKNTIRCNIGFPPNDLASESVVIEINSPDRRIEHRLEVSNDVISNIKQNGSMVGDFKHHTNPLAPKQPSLEISYRSLSPKMNEIIKNAIKEENVIDKLLNEDELPSSQPTDLAPNVLEKRLNKFNIDVKRMNYSKFTKEDKKDIENFIAEDFQNQIKDSNLNPSSNKQLIRFKTQHNQGGLASTAGNLGTAFFAELFNIPTSAEVIHNDIAMDKDHIINKYTIKINVKMPTTGDSWFKELATVSIPFSFKIEQNGQLTSTNFSDPNIIVNDLDLSPDDRINLFSGYSQTKDMIRVMQDMLDKRYDKSNARYA